MMKGKLFWNILTAQGKKIRRRRQYTEVVQIDQVEEPIESPTIPGLTNLDPDPGLSTQDPDRGHSMTRISSPRIGKYKEGVIEIVFKSQRKRVSKEERKIVIDADDFDNMIHLFGGIHEDRSQDRRGGIHINNGKQLTCILREYVQIKLMKSFQFY